MAEGLTQRVHTIAPKASVAIAIGGPFSQVFGGDALASGSDVIFYLLADEIDMDTKQIVAIRSNSKNVEDPEKVFSATYKFNPLA